MSLRAPGPPVLSEPRSEARGIDAFVLVAALARGDHASVQLARSPDASLPPYVVIKRLRDGSANDGALREEAQALASVRSPYVVRAFEHGEQPLPYLVLEYVEGVSLRELIDLAPADRRIRHAIPAMVDALRGLAALHAVSICHQAPCPRHVMIGVDGTAKLIDLSHAAGPHRAAQDARVSTIEMAPEQVLAPGTVDARCDLFIAGVSLWEALTGKRPFADAQGESAVQELLRAPIAAPSQADPLCPPHFDRLLDHALQRAPWKRFAAASEMADALEETARRHGLLATQDERASFLRELIAGATDVRTPQRPSVRAVASRAGISAFGAAPRKDLVDDKPSVLPAAPKPPVAPASAPEPSIIVDMREIPLTRDVPLVSVADPFGVPRLNDALAELPRIDVEVSEFDDTDDIAPPVVIRRSSAARVIGALAITVASALAIAAGAAALRERVDRQPASALPPSPIPTASRPDSPLDLTLSEEDTARRAVRHAPTPSPPAETAARAPAPTKPVPAQTAQRPAPPGAKPLLKKLPPKRWVPKAAAPKPAAGAPKPAAGAPKPAPAGPAPTPDKPWQGGNAQAGSTLQARPVAATPWLKPPAPAKPTTAGDAANIPRSVSSNPF